MSDWDGSGTPVSPDWTGTGTPIAPPPSPRSTKKPWFPMLDTAVWKQKTGVDGYGTPTFDSFTIACDIIYASRVVRTLEGDEIQCSALLTCVENVVPGDTVTISGKDWPVLGLVKVGKDNNRAIQWQQVAF